VERIKHEARRLVGRSAQEVARDEDFWRQVQQSFSVSRFFSTSCAEWPFRASYYGPLKLAFSREPWHICLAVTSHCQHRWLAGAS
jgi:hypothetical protein